MDWTKLILIIAGLIGLGMVLWFSFIFYAFKEFNKRQRKMQKEFQKEFNEKWWGE